MNGLRAPDGVRTAADIPLEQDQPVRVGRCLVTTVYLDSERPRGRIRHRAVKVVEAETGEGTDVDSADLQQLVDLGLPTSFSSAQHQVSPAQRPRQQQQQRPHPPAARANSGGPAAGRPVTQPSRRPQWLQAFDCAATRPYYFQAGTRSAQWEAPPADVVCLPAPLAWSAQIRALQLTPPLQSACGAGEQSGAGVTAATRSQQAAPATAAEGGPRPAADAAPRHGGADGGAAGGDAGASSSGPADGGGGAQNPGHMEGGARADAWVRGPLPRKLWKYWMQRYTLFARFDDGILLDEEGWFSVTPEAVARHHAARCACDAVLDAFAGVGGNAIAFAATCSRVVAGELSADRASLVRHNAAVYGVAGRVEVRCCDFWESTAQVKADVVFLSPPWGGPQYLSQPAFSIAPRLGSLGASLADLLAASRRALQRDSGGGGGGTSGSGAGKGATGGGAPAEADAKVCSGTAGASIANSDSNSVGSGVTGVRSSDGAADIGPPQNGGGGGGGDPVHQQQHSAAASSQQRRGRTGVVAFLPKNTDLGQLSDLVPEGRTLEVERNILDGFFKGITAYIWEGIWC